MKTDRARGGASSSRKPTIAYVLGENLYLNITNRCTNQCRFCLREQGEGIGGYNLWLPYEPFVQEIVAALEEVGELNRFREVVFCGFGEPLLRLEAVKAVASYLKERWGVPVRIDTNGQVNLVYGRDVAPELVGLVDAVSVSLNAPDVETYRDLCRPALGEKAFAAVQDFLCSCRRHGLQVTATAVAYPGVDLEATRRLAEKIGVEFRVRPWLTKEGFEVEAEGKKNQKKLEEMLKGKVIAEADLSQGTVKLVFTDGTRFERTKTFEGMIMATLFAPDGSTILSARI